MDRWDWILGIIIVLGIISAIYIAAYGAHIEADTFNRFSEIKITWWEALWINARVFPTN